MFYIYIIKSLKDGRFYTGMTDNLKKRFEEHNKGKRSTPSTLNRGPFVLVYYEHAKSRNEARKLEKFFKSGAGREFRNKLLSKYSGIAQR